MSRNNGLTNGQEVFAMGVNQLCLQFIAREEKESGEVHFPQITWACYFQQSFVIISLTSWFNPWPWIIPLYVLITQNSWKEWESALFWCKDSQKPRLLIWPFFPYSFSYGVLCPLLLLLIISCVKTTAWEPSPCSWSSAELAVIDTESVEKD